jgi:hypothetical protein
VPSETLCVFNIDRGRRSYLSHPTTEPCCQHKPLRIELGDPSRLLDLLDFFRSVHVQATITDGAVSATLVGPPIDDDGERIRAYLETWLALAAAGDRSIQATIADL